MRIFAQQLSCLLACFRFSLAAAKRGLYLHLSGIAPFHTSIVQVLINKNLNNYIFDNEKLKFIAIVSFLTISGIINYALVFKDKKYLIYFDDFNKISRRTIIWYRVFFALGYISLVVLTIYSFSWLKNIL